MNCVGVPTWLPILNFNIWENTHDEASASFTLLSILLPNFHFLIIDLDRFRFTPGDIVGFFRLWLLPRLLVLVFTNTINRLLICN